MIGRIDPFCCLRFYILERRAWPLSIAMAPKRKAVDMIYVSWSHVGWKPCWVKLTDTKYLNGSQCYPSDCVPVGTKLLWSKRGHKCMVTNPHQEPVPPPNSVLDDQPPNSVLTDPPPNSVLADPPPVSYTHLTLPTILLV